MTGGRVMICLKLLLLAPVVLLAQIQPKNLVRHWNIKDGLSQGVVNSITQDNQSLIWFATEDGLNRFDGYSFKKFRHDPENQSSIADNFIQCVFKDSDGTLWVSSRKGLLKFDQLHERFYTYRHPFSTDRKYSINDVSHISEGSHKNLWVSWYGTGFASFDKASGKFIAYTPETTLGITSEKTLTAIEDQFSLLWVGTQEGGLNVFQVSNGEVIKKIEKLSEPTNLPSGNVRSLAEDKFGNIWIGTSRGLVVYKRLENKFFTFPSNKFGLSQVSIISLFVDSMDNLWIGTQGAGLFQLDLRQFSTRKESDFIFTRFNNLGDFDVTTRTIQNIYEDKDKNIWIGMFGDGVYLISSVKENFVKVQKKLHKNSALSYVSYYGLCFDNNGALWLGSDGNGIFKTNLDGETVRGYSVESRCGLLDNAIISSLRDSRGRLWFGSYSQGLFLYDPRSDSFINFRYRDRQQTKAGGNDVRVVFEDGSGNIWVGTNRGGLCLLNESGRFYENNAGFSGPLANGDVRSLAEDNQGNLWIGFYGDGVYSYSPATGKAVRHFKDGAQKVNSDIVFSIRNDREGRIWLGSGGGGLYSYEPKTGNFAAYTEKNGLSNNTIYGILIDNNDNVWASTNSGISKYDVSKKKFANYNVSDGLQEGQFNPGSAIFNEVGGYMCFGGTLGLNIFYPDNLKSGLKMPDVMLSGLSLFNKPVNINDSIEGKVILTHVLSRTGKITLPHDQNVVTLEFVALNYSYPEKNVYAYKLEGLDEDWNYVGNQRTATYRYINPGEYTFKVKASNVENSWSNEHASVVIEVLPPFWHTSFAYVLYGLTATILISIVYYFTKRQLKLRHRLKIEKTQRKHERQLVQQKLSFFTEISHEFKTPLTLIIGPLEEMLSKEKESTGDGRKLRLVYRNAQKLLNLINKLLDYRKIENGNVVLKVREENVVEFVRETFITFKELANHKNINFQFIAEQPLINLWFDREKLEMVLNNIISNSFKYIGKGDEINVTVSRQVSERYPQGRAVIRIRDNGMGIPKKHLGNIFDWFYKGDTHGTMSSGIGLSLAKKLVHLHKGEIFVDSVEGSGSVFSIKLPVGKDHFKEGEIVEVGSSQLPAGQEKIFAEEVVSAEHDGDAGSKKGFKSLLIIEDDSEIRTFLKDFFEKDYRIFEAENGKEALESASQNHPDLIVSDVMMPEMDGIEFSRRIRNNIRTSHIPIILLTAKSSHTHQKEGMETGADAYITKPFSPEILKLTVTNLLHSRETMMRYYRNLFVSEPVTPSGESDNIKKDTNALDEKFLHTIHEKLISHLDKADFNINELCDELHMSRSLVYKKVKTLTGLSPVEYVRSLRMHEAAKLLRTRNYKVFEVVYMVGFTDVKYFRQCFAKEFGYSPSDFIKQSEGDA
jgi:signal transduction histidine kinase/ligand-binding sensor domain-containing protein/DNA-binding response OmpR family regulator